MNKKPVILIILDGWGHSDEIKHNPIFEAKTPNFDRLWQSNPHATLKASGPAVGLPEGQMGNSEVGHIALGSGTALDTDLVRISKSAANDEFKTNPVFTDLFNHVNTNHSILHIMGLVSPGGVHSHSSHLYEFLRAAKTAGVKKVAIHAFTDGRDTPPQSAHEYLKELEDVVDQVKIAHIATIVGRYYSMDRDKNWDRIEIATDALFKNKGTISPLKPSTTLENLHAQGENDEFLKPIIFSDENGRSYPISKNDGVLFFNFRADRGRELSQKILEVAGEQNLFYSTMAEYDPKLDAKVAFPLQQIETTLAEVIANAGLKQAHIAETEKFAHVTFYFNGGRHEVHQYEEQFLIDTRKDVKTHDLAPDMRAREIADKISECINKDYDFVVANFANPDILGHTGVKPAIIQALETLDNELGKIAQTVKEKDAILLITADHGNAELNIDENGKPHTAHTTSDVPAILIGLDKKLQSGTIADIAPTILDILELPKPSSMTGSSLLDS